MAKNYSLCSEYDSVVLSWIVSKENTEKLFLKLSQLSFKVFSFVLICDEHCLTNRWRNDNICEQRTDDALLKVIDGFNIGDEPVKIIFAKKL